MKTMLKVGLMLAVLALPGMAFATTIQSVTGTADCDGFGVESYIHWGSAPQATISYTATLTDEGGAVVTTVNATEVLPTSGSNTYQTVWYMGVWGLELCGTYTASVDVMLEAPLGNTGNFERSYGSFTATFVCDCPTDACNYTPGFWKNHPEDWAAMELTVGGVTYTQAELLEIMATPVRGDATIILAYHLIAAKLNVLQGSDTVINPTIAEADDLLAMHPIGSRPSGAAREAILDAKNTLAGYNEAECTGDFSGEKALPGDTTGSWSELKATFR
jgi:hypothetical protein